MEGLFFNPWHARGITLLVAPVTSLGGSVADVRLFLTVLSAIAVTADVPVVGPRRRASRRRSRRSSSPSPGRGWFWRARSSRTTGERSSGLASDRPGRAEARGRSHAAPGVRVDRPRRDGAGAPDGGDRPGRRHRRVHPVVAEEVVARPRPVGRRPVLGWLPWVIEMSDTVRRAHGCGAGGRQGAITSGWSRSRRTCVCIYSTRMGRAASRRSPGRSGGACSS